MQRLKLATLLVIVLSIIGIGCGSDNDSMVKDDDIVVKLEKLESTKKSMGMWVTKFRIEVRNIGEKTAWDVEVEVEFLNKHGDVIDIYCYSPQKGEKIKIGESRYNFKIEELKPDSQISYCSGYPDCDVDATLDNFVTAKAPGLDEDTYNVTVTATDASANENEAQSQWSFTVEFDTEPPEVTIVSPAAGARITDLTPKIVANYSDKSEIYLDSLQLTVTDNNGNTLTGGRLEKDQNKVSYTITEELRYGEYTVKLEVSDIYENTAIAKWSFIIAPPGLRYCEVGRYLCTDEKITDWRVSSLEWE